MNKLFQTRKCEECGGFFTVEANRNRSTTEIRVAGPWTYGKCETPKEPVVPAGGDVMRFIPLRNGRR